LLVGAFAIRMISGEAGMKQLTPFANDIFQGVLSGPGLALGPVAGRQLFHGDGIKLGLLAASLVSTWLGALARLLEAKLIGASADDSATLITLGAIASDIAVPAAMRVALPQANPSAYLTASLGVTFPFNLTLDLPLYFWLATYV
jgi:uncharacterized protein